jgi:hypothetical protein
MIEVVEMRLIQPSKRDTLNKSCSEGSVDNVNKGTK